MPAILINGREIASKITDAAAKEVKKLKNKNITPRLEVVLVGENKASEMYCRMKGVAAEKAGIEFALHKLPKNISKNDLIKILEKIQKNKKLSGLILQLPLPEKLYVPEVLNAINPKVDVDFLTNDNLGKLIMNTSPLEPPTPGAIMTILRELKMDLAGRNITIVGMGALVGKPLAVMLANAGASVITCNSRTKDIKNKCLSADVVVTCVGKKDLLRGNMIKPGAIVIDAGINFFDGKVFGDANAQEITAKASYFTPTPGGVGPITVALLLWNTVRCARLNFKN